MAITTEGGPMRWTVGAVSVTKIGEMEQTLVLAGLLPAATPAALEPHADWLAPSFLGADGTTTLSIHAFVIESGGLRILVDTCVGDRAIPGLGDDFRGDPAFLDRLSGAGFPPDSIDVVCCTHLHFDHVGWNTRPEGDRWVPTFMNARHLFCRDEYDHWMAQPGGYAMNLSDTVVPIVDAGLADLVEADHRIDDAVRFVPTPGHSPAHVSVLIESEGQRALITGDATHHPVQWAEPDWGMAGDHDGAQGADTRRRMRDEFSGSTLILGTHYATPTAGHVVQRDGRWVFVGS